MDFLGAAVDFAFGDVALFAGEGGVGEHGILGGDPTAGDVLFFHPPGDGFVDGDAADDAGVAPFDEGGAGGVGSNVIEETDGAELVGGAAVDACSGCGAGCDGNTAHGREG